MCSDLGRCVGVGQVHRHARCEGSDIEERQLRAEGRELEKQSQGLANSACGAHLRACPLVSRTGVFVLHCCVVPTPKLQSKKRLSIYYRCLQLPERRLCECLLGSALAASQFATRQELKRGQTAPQPPSVCVATNFGVCRACLLQRSAVRPFCAAKCPRALGTSTIRRGERTTPTLIFSSPRRARCVARTGAVRTSIIPIVKKRAEDLQIVSGKQQMRALFTRRASPCPRAMVTPRTSVFCSLELCRGNSRLQQRGIALAWFPIPAFFIRRTARWGISPLACITRLACLPTHATRARLLATRTLRSSRADRNWPGPQVCPPGTHRQLIGQVSERRRELAGCRALWASPAHSGLGCIDGVNWLGPRKHAALCT